MTTKEIQKELGKYCILKGHFPVAENVSYALLNWEFDVLSMTKSGYLWEYEVKISISDFRADAKKIRKHKLYKAGIKEDTPNYFTYCCPDGLIKPNEIPEYAGLYYISKWKVKEIIYPRLLHKNKHDKSTIMEKCLRIYTERDFLGCCLLTHKNNEARLTYEENFSNHAR